MPDSPIEPAAEGSYPGNMESRVAVLEYIAGRLDSRFESFERRFESFERRFDGLERRFDAMSHEHRSEFRWLLGIMLAGFGTMLAAFGGLLGVVAHGFHWL